MLPSAVYNRNCSIPIYHCRVFQDLAWKMSLGFYLHHKTHEALNVIVAEY